ncbi:hypothetical protein MTR_8g027740 [Medicago truncatula]|uniref:Uncharacterized protein n=1 Tax=Medicago truncatula TaxID=3880 RepID=G8A2W3_MEDTR|nr:hypothetical protein MTR_8g027740 [Medicago truncatula]
MNFKKWREQIERENREIPIQPVFSLTLFYPFLFEFGFRLQRKIMRKNSDSDLNSDSIGGLHVKYQAMREGPGGEVVSIRISQQLL